MDEIETNEISKNAMGGTEMMLNRLHSTLPKELLDKFQIIPTRVRDIDPDRKTILWIHDNHMDPECEHLYDEESIDRFERIVFVSYTQRTIFCEKFGLPYEKCVVIPNAIEPIIGPVAKPNPDPIRLVYHTTPHRGLNILVPVFQELSKIVNMRLDVFSSYEMYGQPERDEMFKDLIDACESDENIHYHGYKPNEEVIKFVRMAHIFAYPCTWFETSCISAIEALCAGCLVLTPDYGALPETVRPYGLLYQFTEDQHKHAVIFYKNLEAATQMIQQPELKSYLGQQSQIMNSMYNWYQVSDYWNKLLTELANQGVKVEEQKEPAAE